MKRIVALAAISVLFFGYDFSQIQNGNRIETDFEDERISGLMKDLERLVKDAVIFINENSLPVACREFEKNTKWWPRGSYIFIFSNDGTCYLHGSESHVIWGKFGKGSSRGADLYLPGAAARRLEDPLMAGKTDQLQKSGVIFVDEMLERGRDGGWLSYEWDNATKFAYVKTVEKEGEVFIVGAGFYPDSVEFAVKQLVESAIYYGQKYGAGELFRQINNPQGSYVRGDLYLWAYDFKGVAFGHGRNLAIVGQDRLDALDSRGKPRNRMIIDLVRRQGHGWVEYEEDGILKRAYVKSFVDPRTGVPYIIGGGYYPNVNDDTVRNFVERGVNYLKDHGADIAFRDFSSYAGKFIEGPLRLFAYKGSVMVADSENPIFIGQDLYNARDAEGKYIVREIMRIADTAGSGWLTILDKHDYRALYVKKVEVPDGKFIIGSGYWPMSKEHTARALTEKAAIYLKDHPVDEALRAFTTFGNEFIRGDLYVKVYSEDGFCLAAGLDKDRIWHDEKKHLDEKGYPVFDKIKAVARQGGGWVEYPLYGSMVKAFVRMVEKPVILSSKPPVSALTTPAPLPQLNAGGDGFGAWPSWTEQWKAGQANPVPSSWTQLWPGAGEKPKAEDKTKLSFGVLKVIEEEPEADKKFTDTYIVSTGYYV